MWNCVIGAIPQGRDKVLQKRERPVAYKKRTEQRYGRSIRETLLAFMPSVFRSSLHAMWLFAVATVGRHCQGAFWQEIFVTDIKGKTWIIKGIQEANIKDMGGSETAQQPDKQLYEWDGIGRQHASDGCVTDAVSQCHSLRACPSANGHSSPIGMSLPINEECRFDELLVRFRRWVGQSGEKGRQLDGYKRKHGCMSKTKAT